LTRHIDFDLETVAANQKARSEQLASAQAAGKRTRIAFESASGGGSGSGMGLGSGGNTAAEKHYRARESHDTSMPRRDGRSGSVKQKGRYHPYAPAGGAGLGYGHGYGDRKASRFADAGSWRGSKDDGGGSGSGGDGRDRRREEGATWGR
jgi:hypothetical protein